TKLVRCDMRVETVSGHDASPRVIPGRREAANPESRDSGFTPLACPGMTKEKHGRFSELHRRHRLDFGAAGAEVEEFLAGEAEHAGKQSSRHLLDAGVVFLDRVVEEATAGR